MTLTRGHPVDRIFAMIILTCMILGVILTMFSLASMMLRVTLANMCQHTKRTWILFMLEQFVTVYNTADRYALQFVSSRGNEYFCEIDEDYLTDRFNLTGLNTEVPYYQYALDLVTDVFDLDADDDLREQIEKSARHLYGLVHARYITTTRGLAKMVSVSTFPTTHARI